MSGMGDEVREALAEWLYLRYSGIHHLPWDELFEAGRDRWRSDADALAPLILRVEAHGAAAVVERVEAAIESMPMYANWSYIGRYTNGIRAALTTEGADQREVSR